jgi:O-antigen/teichoic acid export membrane protein
MRKIAMSRGVEAAWVMFGQGLFALGSVFGIAALTKMLDPSEYGNMALTLTVWSCAQLLIFGPMSMGAMRWYSVAAEKDQLRDYLVGLGRLTVLPMVAIGSLGLVAGVLGHWSRWMSSIAVAPALFYALPSGLNSVADGLQSAARQRMRVALHQGVGQWLRVGVAIVFLVLWQRSVAAVIYGFALASCVVLVSQVVGLRKLVDIGSLGAVELRDATTWESSIRSYSMPFAFWGVFAWLQLACERWTLKLFSSSGDVGLYSVVFQLGYYPISVIAGSLVLLIAPILYAQAGDGSNAQQAAVARSTALRLAAWVLGICLVLTLLAWAVAGYIFGLLTPPKYHPAGSFFPAMMLSGGLIASAEVLALRSHLRLNPEVLLKPKIGTALIGIVLSTGCAYWFGLRGVVVARLLSSVCYAVWILLVTSNALSYLNLSFRLRRAIYLCDHAARAQCKRLTAVYTWNARRKAAALARNRKALVGRYRDRIALSPSLYEESRVLSVLGDRLHAKYGVLPKPRGSLRIVWVGADESQDMSGFAQALAEYGQVVTVRQPNGKYGLERRLAGDRRPLDRDLGRRNAALLLEQVSEAHRQGSVDVLLGQIWAHSLDPSGLQAVQQLGIPTVAVSMDDRLPHLWNSSGGRMAGCPGLAPGLDLVLTSSPECCEWYWIEDTLALYWPMASNPKVYFPRPSKRFDVTFVGSRYGFRSRLVDHLCRAGIAVSAFGPGWPAGAIKAAEMSEILGQSKIVLGSGFVAYNEDVTTLKLRDFDAPMAGAMYLTHRNPDLLALFKEGEEIECYDSIQECERKLRLYLSDPSRRQAIADAGLHRAKANHTWNTRLEDAFRALRMLP